MRQHPAKRPISILKVPAWNDVYLSNEKYQDLKSYIAKYGYDSIPISQQDEVLHEVHVFRTLERMNKNNPNFMVDVHVEGQGRKATNQVWGTIVDSVNYEFHKKNSLCTSIHTAIKFGELQKVDPRPKYSKPKVGSSMLPFSVRMARLFHKDKGTISAYTQIYDGLTLIDRNLLTYQLHILQDLNLDTLREVTERQFQLNAQAKSILRQALADAVREKRRYLKAGMGERQVKKKVNADFLKSISNQLKQQIQAKATLPTQHNPVRYMTTDSNGKLCGDTINKMDDLLQSLKGFMRTRKDGNDPAFIPDLVRMRLGLDNLADRLDLILPRVHEWIKDSQMFQTSNGNKLMLKKEAWKPWE